MTFNGLALAAKAIQVRDGPTGRLITQVGLPSSTGRASPPWATPSCSGSAYSPEPAGIEVLTPGGAPPVVPGPG